MNNNTKITNYDPHLVENVNPIASIYKLIVMKFSFTHEYFFQILHLFSHFLSCGSELTHMTKRHHFRHTLTLCLSLGRI